jgi:trehalose 6-phosphate synthase
MITNREWNKERLADLAAKSFRRMKLIVVSCRAPYVHERVDGKVVCVSPAGGLTAALKPTMAAVGGTWIAQASGSADRETASPSGKVSVPPDAPRFSLRRLWIAEELRRGHYEGLSNRALWPLCHNVFQRPIYRESDWAAYRRVNQIFARAVLEEAAGEPAAVFIQDYHFGLLPRMLKWANPSLTVAQFWHIPFPNREAAQTFPWMDELLDGMLGNDVLGFHLPQHCGNFIDAVDECLGAPIERATQTVWTNGSSTSVREAPISIDFDQHAREAASGAVEDAMQQWRQRIGPVQHVGVGIDRMDYTKGIPERLRALSAMFRRNSSLRGNLTFVQVGVPSRSTIAEYAQLEREIEQEVRSINEAWRTDTWTPVIFEKRNLPSVEMMALHRLARFCMVTPLHDGMNLVAKEFVASRLDSDGVLILSRFAGAAKELRTALIVNPYSESDLCDAISGALSMPRSERQARMTGGKGGGRAEQCLPMAGRFASGTRRIAQTRTQGVRRHCDSKRLQRAWRNMASLATTVTTTTAMPTSLGSGEYSSAPAVWGPRVLDDGTTQTVICVCGFRRHSVRIRGRAEQRDARQGRRTCAAASVCGAALIGGGDQRPIC